MSDPQTLLQTYRKQLSRLASEYEIASRLVSQETESLDDAIRKEEKTTQAQRLVQQVAETVQNRSHRQVATIVSRALQTVFGEEKGYQFRIKFEQKRGKTEASLLFLRDDQEIDPTTAAGGGVIEVAAFALRLACLLLSLPRRRRLLVLDEPFRCVSRAVYPVLRDLLLTLAKEMQVQFLIVTHAQELAGGTVIEIG